LPNWSIGVRNIRKYNNNIILADDNGQEVIVLGKGIGFQALPGVKVDMSLVEKVFIPQDAAHINRFADTLSGLAYEFVLLASKIVDYGKESLQVRLNPSIVVALADHFSVSLTQPLYNTGIQSPLELDVRHMYPREFQIGLQALEIIRRERNIEMNEAEAVSIALHFINAELESPEMPLTFRIVTISGDVLRIIEQYYHVVLDKTTLEFMRLSSHVRNLVIEYLSGSSRKRDLKEDNELYDILMARNRDVAECCGRIETWLREKHKLPLLKNDLSFLAIHITKILKGIKKR
jgi:beta-glucoside operon transcriptional antiterminator